ncbi:MAG: hypothetical protein QOJ07_1200 [Thermoleophilaceae bacterium]|nr:hypothetical protein [Thermoleophilaceae bacterium]
MADAGPSDRASERDTRRGGARGERLLAWLGTLPGRFARWARRFAGESARAWRYLDFEQRVAGVGALLLLVSTFGSFSFVEAAVVLVALGVLLLLKKRADGRSFHLPFGDGAVIMAAGAWSGVLIVIRLFDRPLGQNMLALVCAAILVLAGLRMRVMRPADDLPQSRGRSRTDHGVGAGATDIEFAQPDTPETRALATDEEPTEALATDGDDVRRAPAPPPPPALPPSNAPPASDAAPERENTRPRLSPSARRAARAPSPLDLPPPAPAQAPPQRRPAPPPADPDFDVPAPPSEGMPPPPPAPADEPGPFRARPAEQAPPGQPPRRRPPSS